MIREGDKSMEKLKKLMNSYRNLPMNRERQIQVQC